MNLFLRIPVGLWREAAGGIPAWSLGGQRVASRARRQGLHARTARGGGRLEGSVRLSLGCHHSADVRMSHLML